MRFKLLSSLVIVTLLNGCASMPPENLQTVPLADAACNVNAASVAHILRRHCQGGAAAGTQFADPAVQCTLAALQTLCTAAQTAPNVDTTRVVQADAGVRYDVNMRTAYGVGGEKCVRLVITSAANGHVVTLFPEAAGAPGNCN